MDFADLADFADLYDRVSKSVCFLVPRLIEIFVKLIEDGCPLSMKKDVLPPLVRFLNPSVLWALDRIAD